MADAVTNATLTALATQANNLAAGIDTCWILICATLVVIMQVGFAYVEAGNVRVKNVRSILLKNTVDYVIGGLMFFVIGNGITRGKSMNGIIGTDNYLSQQADDDTTAPGLYMATTFYTALFACTASTIISGSIAERMDLRAYMVISALSPIFLFSLPAHWVWNENGFLNSSDNRYLAMSDFAGGAVVHMVGGIAALTSAWFVGPRIGRFNTKSGYDRSIEGHSVVLGGLGSWLIIFGWFGFNAGSSLGISSPDSAYNAASAALNTFLSIISGALISLLYQSLVHGKLNLGEMFNGMLAGAAGITAGCAFFTPLCAILVGVLTTFGYIISVQVVARKLKIDDPLNAISVHLTGGGLGVILIGFLHKDDGLLFSGDPTKLAAQMIGIVVVALNTLFWCGGTLLLYSLTIGPVRVEEKIEIAGCDIELDGIGAYQREEEGHLKYNAIRVNPKFHEEFVTFLKCIYCHQNVSFLDDLEKFEIGISDLTVDSQTEAQFIFDTYISLDATDPLNIPEWQITQVKKALQAMQVENDSAKKNTLTSKSTALQSLFTVCKNEVYTILDTTIATHFSTTPAYQKFVKSGNDSETRSAPLSFVQKWWCCRRGPKKAHGRPRPFDPFKKFKHTEMIEDVDSDDEDPESSLGMSSRVAPTGMDSEDDSVY